MTAGAKTEAALVAAVLTVGAAAAGSYLDASGGLGAYYQEDFGAAVMEACGRGFVDAAAPRAEALDDFLLQRRDSIACDELGAAPPKEATPFQRVHWHLLQSVALVWRLFGVSWSAVSVLAVLLYAMTAAAAYALFRLASGRAIASLLAFGLAISAQQLHMLRSLRDYGKAPFFVALLACLGGAVSSGEHRKRTIGLAAVAGAMVGVGIGFRRDLLIGAPFALLVLTAFPSPGTSWRRRAAAAGAFLLSMVVAGWPALAILAEGVNSWHVLILGLMTPFDAALGVDRPFYEIGRIYEDHYVHSLVNSYAWRTGMSEKVLGYSTGAYDVAGARFFFEVYRTFPADALVRAYAGAMRALDATAVAVPLGSGGEWLRSAVTWANALRAPLALPHAGSLLALAAVLLLAARSVRLGLLGALSILYFAGYTSLVFQLRHYFHIEVVPLWGLGLLLSSMLAVIRSWVVQGPGVAMRRIFDHRRARRALVLMATIGLALAGLLQLARAGQVVLVRNLVSRIESVPVEPLPGDQRAADEGRVFLALDPKVEPASAAQQPVGTAYLLFAFEGQRCGRSEAEIRLRYRTAAPFRSLSTLRSVPLSPQGTTRLFAPVYDYRRSPGWRAFMGVSLSAEDLGCLTGIYRAAAIDQTTLLPWLTLTPGWQRGPLYQRMK